MRLYILGRLTFKTSYTLTPAEGNHSLTISKFGDFDLGSGQLTSIKSSLFLPGNREIASNCGKLISKRAHIILFQFTFPRRNISKSACGWIDDELEEKVFKFYRQLDENLS